MEWAEAVEFGEDVVNSSQRRGSKNADEEILRKRDSRNGVESETSGNINLKSTTDKGEDQDTTVDDVQDHVESRTGRENTKRNLEADSQNLKGNTVGDIDIGRETVVEDLSSSSEGAASNIVSSDGNKKEDKVDEDNANTQLTSDNQKFIPSTEVKEPGSHPTKGPKPFGTDAEELSSEFQDNVDSNAPCKKEDKMNRGDTNCQLTPGRQKLTLSTEVNQTGNSGSHIEEDRKAVDEDTKPFSSEMQNGAYSNAACEKEKAQRVAEGTLDTDNTNGIRKDPSDDTDEDNAFVGSSKNVLGNKKLVTPTTDVRGAEGLTSPIQNNVVGNAGKPGPSFQGDSESGFPSEVDGSKGEGGNVVIEKTEQPDSSEIACSSEKSALKKYFGLSAAGYGSMTLEVFLDGLGLFPRLLQLDESLQEVRWYRRTAEEHEAECKLLDKELLKLSRQCHPDSVMQKGGSEEELARAKELQTALNATRTILNTLSKMFLEDTSIEHKYEFFTKLDIFQLGNEDVLEDHAYEVLLKISLISEIKQGTFIGCMRGFLNTVQRGVSSYLATNIESFIQYRRLAFIFVERCVNSWKKLYAEHEEMEIECGKEKLHNIYPTISKMKRDCSIQLRHLEVILELWKRPFGELFPMYSSRFPVDEYLVLPLVCYTNVMLSCSVMLKITSEENTVSGWFARWAGNRLPNVNNLLGRTKSISMEDVDARDNDCVYLLYKLALCYGGNAESTIAMKEVFGWQQQPTKEIVKEKFLEILKDVEVVLESKFKVDNYVIKNTKTHILKELKACKEMLVKIEKTTRGVERDLQNIHKNHEYVANLLDEVKKNQNKVSDELDKYSKIFLGNS